MLLQHAVKYDEAQKWIHLQDQQQLTHQSLPTHCKLLESHCEQFEKAMEKGCAELTTLSAASSTSLYIHQDATTTHTKCPYCGYSHL